MKEKKKGYGQVLGCDLLLELVKAPLEPEAEWVFAELDEQLDWAPPELDDEVDSWRTGEELPPIVPWAELPDPDALKLEPPPLDDKVWNATKKFGAEALSNALLRVPKELVALELEEQPPELPLTPVAELALCVLEELLQLYAIDVLGMDAIRNVAATNMVPIKNIWFMFVCLSLYLRL